jgi:hypothetical protein
VAVSVFKTACDLASPGWVGSIPMHSRHDDASMRAEPMTRAIRHLAVAATAALLFVPGTASAQAVPLPPSTVAADARDTAVVPRTPLTPRRALLYSMAIPGMGQSRLGRHRAAAGMLLVEGIGLLMLRETGAEIRQAMRLADDSVVTSYVDGAGAALAQPQRQAGQFREEDVRTRRGHREDWIALLVANHLISGAEAFVAAHLWDVPFTLGVQPGPEGGALVALRVRW